VNILDLIASERAAQDYKWGEQNHQDLASEIGMSIDSDTVRVMYASQAALHKRLNDARVKQGDIAWDSILLEEVYEALELAGDPSKASELADELVQVAAVAVAWVEALKRRHTLAHELQAQGPDEFPFGHYVAEAEEMLKGRTA
jgi:hypothetical protein